MQMLGVKSRVMSEANNRTLGRLRDDTVYKVLFPDGREKRMNKASIRVLPHWNFCTVVVSAGNVSFSLPEPPSSEPFPLQGSGSGTMQNLQTSLSTARINVGILKASIQERQMRLLEWQDTLSRHKAALPRAVRLLKEPSNAVVRREELVNNLMRSDDILDVRMPGEELPYIPQLDSHALNTVLSSAQMSVTFVGPVIDSEFGSIPLPPITFVINNECDRKLVTGGLPSFHPHVCYGESCLGSEGGALAAVIERKGNIYGLIDFLRAYRFGYEPSGELWRSWNDGAWYFWCHTLNYKGWPEPFMKPWYSAGMPVQECGSDDIIPIARYLGASDDMELRSLLHVGADARVWSISPPEIGMNYPLYSACSSVSYPDKCPCGVQIEMVIAGDESVLDRMPELELADGACSCHVLTYRELQRANPADPQGQCPTCHREAVRCRCPHAVSQDWTDIDMQGGVPSGCECYNCNNPAAHFLTRGAWISSYYEGPWLVCGEHLPAGPRRNHPAHLPSCARCGHAHRGWPLCACGMCGSFPDDHIGHEWRCLRYETARYSRWEGGVIGPDDVASAYAEWLEFVEGGGIGVVELGEEESFDGDYEEFALDEEDE